MAVRRNILNELNTIGLNTTIRVGEGRKQAPRKRGGGSRQEGWLFEASSP